MKTESKRNAAITAEIVKAADGTTNVLVLNFANEETLNIFESELTETIQRQAMMHGLKQKLIDAAAMSRDPITGKPATIEDKYRAVKVVYDRLLSGEWNAVREGGGNAGGLLLQALCIVYPTKSKEELREWLGKKTKADQAALRDNPKIKPIIDELRAKSASDGPDTDEMLAELE